MSIFYVNSGVPMLPKQSEQGNIYPIFLTKVIMEILYIYISTFIDNNQKNDR